MSGTDCLWPAPDFAFRRIPTRLPPPSPPPSLSPRAFSAASSSSSTATTMASPSSTTPVKYVLADGEDARPYDRDALTWLADAPRGAYTTARTVNVHSVFELDFHISRMASSTRLMLEADAQKGAADPAAAERLAVLTDADRLRPLYLASLRVRFSFITIFLDILCYITGETLSRVFS
jgi:hypothetical protein